MGLGCVREIRRPKSDASDVGFRRCSRPWKFGMEDRENSDSYSVMILDLAKCFVTNNVRRVCRQSLLSPEYAETPRLIRSLSVQCTYKCVVNI